MKKIIIYVFLFVLVLFTFSIIYFINNYFSERVKVYIENRGVVYTQDFIQKSISENVINDIKISELYIINKDSNKEYTSTTVDINNITIDDKLKYILNAFNGNQHIKATVQKIPFMSKRYNDLMLSIETYGFEEVLEAIQNLDSNEFFRSWKPSFDWVVNPNNMIKIIEGNYKHNDKQTGDASKEWLEKWVAEDED